MSKPKFTEEQKIVIQKHGRNMLVSASAGAGKTTVMIERIVEQLKSVDVGDMIIVTFTNLAAGEMKERLINNLSDKLNMSDVEMRARGFDRERLTEQLDKIDSANISTLHSFCGDLLRNYFYAINLDPAFVIFDEATASTLKNSALQDLLAEKFAEQDEAKKETFENIYKIFATKRKEENFTKLILRLHAFSRCLVNLKAWHAEKKENFVSKITKILLDDVKRTVEYYRDKLVELAEESGKNAIEVNAEGAPNKLSALQKKFEDLADILRNIDLTDLEKAGYGITHYNFGRLPLKIKDETVHPKELDVRNKYGKLKKKLDVEKKKYANLLRTKKDTGLEWTTLWQENSHMVAYIEELVELVDRFDEIYADYKTQRGGVDYDDLEHLALKLLNEHEEILDEIHSRYKLIFVDEYQDTNPIQEAIIQVLSTEKTGDTKSRDNLFMVGDVKQSIYGFRGCDSTIFTEKEAKFTEKKALDGDYDLTKDEKGWKVELNDNFRSNCDVLDFVNAIFNAIMTKDFGDVNYQLAQLKGHTKMLSYEEAKNSQDDDKTVSHDWQVSVCVDVLSKDKQDKVEAEGLYNIEAKTDDDVVLTQGELIARHIEEYVDKTFNYEITDAEGNVEPKSKTIAYDDVVILMRGLTDKALDVYETLRQHGIPVSAKFKVDALENKEIKDLVNLFRVVDNPYVDVSLVGACLSCFGGFSEADLGNIRLDANGDMSFYERLRQYKENNEKNDLGSQKIPKFLQLIEDVRFYSRSASVDEVALYVIAKTHYNLYVQGLPNGELRLNKLYAFIDSLKGLNYAQSIDKFLAYIDDTDDHRAEEALSAKGCVRMMTMHASKGLEFPIVFVAGLESQFVFDYFDVEQNSNLGLATRYYDFDEMKRADTLGFYALRLANERKQREEEMRLLYVAMTRAKFVLNLVATCNDDDNNSDNEDDGYDDDSDGSYESSDDKKDDGDDVSYNRIDKVRCHRDWVLPIVNDLNAQSTFQYLKLTEYQMFGKEETNTDNPTDGEDSSAVTGEKNDNGGKKTSENDEKATNGTGQPPEMSASELIEAEAIFTKLSKPYKYQKETDMPTKVVSSMLDKDYIKKFHDDSQTEEEEPQNEQVLNTTIERNLVGTAYHRLYEMIFNDAAHEKKKDGTATIDKIVDCWTVDDVISKIAELVAEGEIKQEEADNIDVKLVCATLHNPTLLSLLEGGEVYPEKPFMVSVPYRQLDTVKNKDYEDNVILQGVIDLLIIKDRRAVVIDFKYTMHKELIENNYRLQLNSYKLAVQRILGKKTADDETGIEEVEAYVLSIKDNEFIKM